MTDAVINPQVRLSFEFFPPKKEEDTEKLRETFRALLPYKPEFISVTYGAGGTSRAYSFAALELAKAEIERAQSPTELVAHLTCVGAKREESDAEIARFAEIGIRHFLALRGDPQGGIGNRFIPTEGGYENAAALARGIKNLGDYAITVPAKNGKSTSRK